MNNSLSINCQGAINIAPTANERTNSSIAESLQFNPHQITLPNEDSIAPHKTITDSLDEIHQHNETAKKANIDIAKKDFIAAPLLNIVIGTTKPLLIDRPLNTDIYLLTTLSVYECTN